MTLAHDLHPNSWPVKASSRNTAEDDAKIARYLATKKATKCPTVCVLPVTGGVLSQLPAQPVSGQTYREGINQSYRTARSQGKGSKKGCVNSGEEHRRRTQAVREQVAAEYRKDQRLETITRLALDYGRKVSTIREYLRQAGLEIPKRQPDRRDPALEAAIGTFYREGWSREQTAKAFGICHQTVTRALTSAGIKLRGQHEMTPKRGMTPPDMSGRAA